MLRLLRQLNITIDQLAVLSHYLHNEGYPTEVTFVHAVNEFIDRVLLFTLQEGISSAQMNEMKEAHIHLVVPKMNIKCFPAECQKDLCSLAGFINIVKDTQE